MGVQKILIKIFLVLIAVTVALIACFELSDSFVEYISLVSSPLRLGLMRKKIPPVKAQSVFVAGDIMLDRGVERLIQKSRDWQYPFKEIASTSKNFDFALANLEGPVMGNPPDTGISSMSFAFASSTLLGAQEANFRIFSLANNHTYNMSYSGLDETRLLLGQLGMRGVGHPFGCTTTDIYATGSLVFFTFNDTFPGNCTSGQLVSIITALRQENTTSLIMVMPHWGEEYSLYSNARQKDLAHTLVAAGADLIVGSHPHVVQEIEQYQGKLIFYSLGNFIFDQYFSKNTQQGLGLGLSISENTSSLALWPLDLSLSQPKLMDATSSALFLQSLSGRSSPELSEAIKKCYIEIEHKP